MDAIPIFSLATSSGVFRIEADRSAFEIAHRPPGRVHVLRNDRFPHFSAAYEGPYDAILAVAQHRTGIAEWDASPEVVSDYAPDWVRHTDKRFQMRLLDAYLTARPGDSLRQMVDYFEQRHGYFMDRTVIDDLLTELVTTGQLDRLPNMDFAPAEMKGLARIAAHWGVASGERGDSD